MPLIKCPACQAEISPNAPACPKCGEPIKSSVEKAQGGAINMKDPVHLVGIVLVIIIVIGVIISVAKGL